MKTIVITGATSGIGLETAKALAGEEYRILGVGRSKERCEKAKTDILTQVGNAEAMCFTADLMQQREVLRAAEQIIADLEATGGELHALIHNTGCVRSWYMTTDEGYEQQFALNYLAAFLLTRSLFPKLRQAKGRVILTGSGSHRHTKVRWDDVMLSRRYNPLLAYKQSKLCGMLFAEGINDRFADAGVRAFVADPGLVNTEIGSKETGGLVRLVWALRKGHGVSPEIPAKTFVWLCDPKNDPQGLYYGLHGQEPYSRQVTRANADRLWKLSEKLCGVHFGKETCE